MKAELKKQITEYLDKLHANNSDVDVTGNKKHDIPNEWYGTLRLHSRQQNRKIKKGIINIINNFK